MSVTPNPAAVTRRRPPGAAPQPPAGAPSRATGPMRQRRPGPLRSPSLLEPRRPPPDNCDKCATSRTITTRSSRRDPTAAKAGLCPTRDRSSYEGGPGRVVPAGPGPHKPTRRNAQIGFRSRVKAPPSPRARTSAAEASHAARKRFPLGFVPQARPSGPPLGGNAGSAPPCPNRAERIWIRTGSWARVMDAPGRFHERDGIEPSRQSVTGAGRARKAIPGGQAKKSQPTTAPRERPGPLPSHSAERKSQLRQLRPASLPLLDPENPRRPA